eukprot:1149753-Pelagomonas_calceolata.AAC.2
MTAIYLPHCPSPHDGCWMAVHSSNSMMIGGGGGGGETHLYVKQHAGRTTGPCTLKRVVSHIG